jgi:signal transduction histidine kinase
VVQRNWGWLVAWKQHCQKVLLGVPVFIKVLGIALGMAIFLWAGMLWQIRKTWRDLLLEDLQQRGRALAQELAVQCSELAQAGRGSNIAHELSHSLLKAPEAVYVTVRDRAGDLLADARAPGSSPPAAMVHEFEAIVPGGGNHLRVGISATRVKYQVDWLVGRLARTTAVIALLGLLAAWFLAHFFTRPIQELVTLARAVKAGQYDLKAQVRAQDEVGELAAAFNEMTAAIRHKENARQKLLRQVISAGEEERKRVARELHDHTGQSLTSQIAVLSAVEHQCSDPRLRKSLVEVRALTEQTLAEVHDLAVALRPAMLDDLGLTVALQRHCQKFQERFKLQVVCPEGGLGEERLPPEIELTIYRVVQEALTNAVRHGSARRVHVLVQPVTRGVLVTVRDNGVGFDGTNWRERCLQGNHLGLLGLEERVTLLNGSFCVESQPGRGTIVYAELPLATPMV